MGGDLFPCDDCPSLPVTPMHACSLIHSQDPDHDFTRSSCPNIAHSTAVETSRRHLPLWCLLQRTSVDTKENDATVGVVAFVLLSFKLNVSEAFMSAGGL